MCNARCVLNSISSNEILSRGNHIQLYYHFTWQMVTVREHICSHSDSIYALNFLYVWFSISKILSKYDNIYNAVMTHLFEKWAQYCKITRHILAPLTVNVNIFSLLSCVKGKFHHIRSISVIHIWLLVMTIYVAKQYEASTQFEVVSITLHFQKFLNILH